MREGPIKRDSVDILMSSLERGKKRPPIPPCGEVRGLLGLEAEQVPIH